MLKKWLDRLFLPTFPLLLLLAEQGYFFPYLRILLVKVVFKIDLPYASLSDKGKCILDPDKIRIANIICHLKSYQRFIGKIRFPLACFIDLLHP